MTDLLTFATTAAVDLINAMGLLVVALGAVQAFVNVAQSFVAGDAEGERYRIYYSRFARWLVVGLTFQLAADIIATSIAPSWDEIGRLAAIAAIRTILSFFVERELAELDRRRAPPKD